LIVNDIVGIDKREERIEFAENACKIIC
jgi:hypothetical protein